MERRLFGLLSLGGLVSTAPPPLFIQGGAAWNLEQEQGSASGTLLGPEGSSDRFLWAATPSNFLASSFVDVGQASEDSVEEPPVI